MFRLGLALYLSIVTAAGPWLCCCAATRLALVLPAPPAVAASEPNPPPCCCRHHDAERSPPTARPGESPQPEGPGCPCRQHAEQRVALVPASAEPVAELSRPIGLAVVRLAGPAIAGSVRTFDVPPAPFCSADELCRVHHLLRC